MNDAQPQTASTVQSSAVLASLVLLVFCTGSAEYLAAGVLPQVAANLSVDIATAGQAVTAYALGVAVGGPIVTVLTARMPRKGLALSLGAVFIAGTLLTAFAPTFGWLVVGRVIAASSQATLFAIGLVTATTAAGPGHAGRAIAIVTSGLTAATVLGVPLGVLLGGGTSWRLPFTIVAAAAGVGVALLGASMTRTPAPSTGVANEVHTLLHVPVLLAVATTSVGFAGVSVVFTYLVPLLTDVTGLTEGVVPALLLAYGAGGFLGNLVAGRLADASVGRTLKGVLVALIVTLAAFPLAAEQAVPMVLLVLVLGLLSTATIAPLQSLLLRHASGAPTLSLAVNVGAFNLANSIGSALGGIGVAAGLLRWGGIAGAALAGLGLVLAGLALRAKPFTSASTRPSPDQKEDAFS